MVWLTDDKAHMRYFVKEPPRDVLWYGVVLSISAEANRLLHAWAVT
jgi:hypothetical protein